MVDRAKLRRWSSSSIILRKRVIETSFLYDPSYVTSHLASHAWGLPRISPFNARVASAAPAAFVLTAKCLRSICSSTLGDYGRAISNFGMAMGSQREGSGRLVGNCLLTAAVEV